MMGNRRREDGFTLIELMVVIVIIGLLATVVVLNVLPAQDKAMRTKARADIALIEQAAELYRLDALRYPPSLTALSTGKRPYLKSLPADPWGNAYQYRVPGQRGAVDIYSLGADGQPGGEGEDADIGNWG